MLWRYFQFLSHLKNVSTNAHSTPPVYRKRKRRHFFFAHRLKRSGRRIALTVFAYVIGIAVLLLLWLNLVRS